MVIALLLFMGQENMNTHRNVLPYPQNALHFEAGVWLKYILTLLKQFFVYILRYELVQIKPSHFRPQGHKIARSDKDLARKQLFV